MRFEGAGLTWSNRGGFVLRDPASGQWRFMQAKSLPKVSLSEVEEVGSAEANQPARNAVARTSWHPAAMAEPAPDISFRSSSGQATETLTNVSLKPPSSQGAQASARSASGGLAQATAKQTDSVATGNLLIHSDCFHAARALLPWFEGQVSLIYAAPPFNTGSRTLAYEDNLAHPVWLSFMENRLEALKPLLRLGGVIAVHIGRDEQPYLRVLMDELFGRGNLVSQVSWQRAPDRTLLGQGESLVNDCVEYILLYSNGPIRRDLAIPKKEEPMSWKTFQTYGRTLVFSDEKELVAEFAHAARIPGSANPAGPADSTVPAGSSNSVKPTESAESAGSIVRIFRHKEYRIEPIRSDDLKRIFLGAGDQLKATFPRIIRLSNQQQESTFQQALLSHMPLKDVLYSAEFKQTRGKHKGLRTRYYLNKQVVLFLKDVAFLKGNRVVRVADLNNLWTDEEIPATGIAREGGIALKRGKKPESLLRRIITAFSVEGEIVLDPFAGTGTTGAVAHKSRRGWIMVDESEQAIEQMARRMKSVVAGTDTGGVTRTVGWAGGGGFKVMRAVQHKDEPDVTES